MTELIAYKNPDHPSNRIRPKVMCWGCGKIGCVGKHWGNWCFQCNVARIDKISAVLETMESAESYHRRLAAIPVAEGETKEK